jgi:hypothetical protein
MEFLFLLFVVLLVLLVLLAIITVAGHAMWLVTAALLRFLFSDGASPNYRRQSTRIFEPSIKPVDDLDITERQIVSFYIDAKIDERTYNQLIRRIRAERASVTPAVKVPASVPVPPPKPVEVPRPVDVPSVVTAALVASDDEIVIKPVPTFIIDDEPPPPRYERPTPPPRPPRRPFSEVLNSFMEESNIRWGEIIGGLLIIGCSTALVVSLWAQISQIPVLKFLIFTTVTAILFGIGLYTEHRWKLPTTSRGILTIATLLVPLNFLAIAAVSASNTSGALVIGSELLAPAIFLCLVYFAGRVITPGCAHILSAGVLGSSVGQLLVRHFAAIDTSPALLVLLGAFPVACYVATVGLALRIVLDDREIDASETTTVFTILGTMSFAALLPFGLLLYKSGQLSMSMMYLAPLVTLWGLPMLATGTILWRRINNRELVASRTTGTALGILGVMIVLAGMMLAWPNPASIVPAALLNFAIFTALAVALELPVAHLIAAICFALAYLVTSHVVVGNITWQNLRVMSLLDVSFSVASGQVLVGAFALFVIASEWLSQRRRERDSHYYLISACLIGVVSLALATMFGIWGSEYHALWVVYGFYSLGAFWIAWCHKLLPFTWIGSALLLFSLAHGFSYALSFSFPWQTALFAHATICAVAAIVSSRYERGEVLAQPLNYSALISIVFGVVSLFQANTWEVTWMQAQRVFWIAGILLLLLWLNRRQLILNAFQIALICGLVLTVKAALQQYEWYSYLPHAFLHPAALQIQGTVLALFCLAWLGLRFLAKRAQDGWLADTSRLLDSDYSVDRFVVWLLLGGFLLLAVYGALSGVAQEFAAAGSGFTGFNIAGFPHQEALGLGSWIVLGLLLLAMLASAFERRSSLYLLGALTTLAAIIPLLAGKFEHQIATATAWRWLAAIFLLCGSVVIWYRGFFCRGGPLWPPQRGMSETGAATEGRPYNSTEGFAKQARTLLIALTFAPLAVLTIYPALRAIYYLPIQSPVSGFFSVFDDGVSYGFPLVLTGVVMIGYALRERMPRFAFYAGALFNATVTLAFLLAVVTSRGLMDRVVLVRLVQLNALTLAVYLLPWLSTRGRWEGGLSQKDQRLADYLLKLQLALAVVLNLALFFPAVTTLVVAPEKAGAGTIATGSFLGWLTFFTTVIAAAWLTAKRTIRSSADMLAALLVGVGCLLAASATEVSGWVGLHTLAVWMTLSAWLMLLAAEMNNDRSLPWLRFVFDFGDGWQSRCRHIAAIMGSVAVILSLRGLADAQTSRWWSIGPLLAITALAATLNWKTLERRYIYAAGILFNLAVSLWWIFIFEPVRRESRFLLTNVIAGSLAGILWLWLELRSQRLRQRKTLLALSFHNLAAISALGVLILIVIVSSFVGGPLLYAPLLSWLTFLAVLAFMTACLWDRHTKYAAGGLYVLGLIACAIALRQLGLSSTRYAWSATIVLAAYTVFVALLWHRRRQLIDFAKQLGVPERISPDATELNWLSAYSIVAVVIVSLLAYWINVSFLDLGLRVSAGLALAAQFLTFGLLAEGVREQNWRRAAIGAGVVGAVLIGWSWLTPGANATWLNRSVILMLETFGLTALYGFALNKANARWPQWTNAARSCVPWLLGAGVVALFFCLGTEISYQIEFGAVRIHPLALVAIGLTLVAAVVISVLFALSPSHDPLNLSERGRMRYVYVAEVMLALLFLHIRLTMPWLFTGFIERYWPLVIMLIAYFGIVVSEALRQRKLLVLAQPIERTGAFLPLLPVLGFWLASSEVDFSAVLFLIGGLYGLLSILRRSFGFGLLAAVAGNAGLWYVWQRTTDYGFLQHPQLWLIPVALSVLLAAYLNEDKLTEDQMTGVRYLSLVTIYASSTADIFINGVANSPWLPLILGSFSLAGVFAGILFRIRGLLLLGAIFLLLSIITMIWYASANFGWTWLWYVAGIVTGATIIFMFALFEKKRSEVLRVVEGLKEWDR